VAAIDQIPDWVSLAGLAAYDRREPTVKVADLISDSLMTRTEAWTRPRRLRFATEAQSVEVEVTPNAATLQLAIVVSPAAAVRLDVRPIHGRTCYVWSGPRGDAECSGVPPGPMSVLVHWPLPVGPVRTAWVQI
jgi:hypothetical protein